MTKHAKIDQTRQNQPAGHVMFEALEDRRLMSAVALTVTTTNLSGGKVQLNISDTTANDQITIATSKTGLLVSNSTGWSANYANVANVVVRAGTGNAKVEVDANVNATLYAGDGNDTLVGGTASNMLIAGAGKDQLVGHGATDTFIDIAGGHDTMVGSSGFDSFWVFKTDVLQNVTAREQAAGAVHQMGAFYSLSGKAPTWQFEPSATVSNVKYTSFSSDPLFAPAGPIADDIRQGYIGDCYYFATLSSIAKTNPMRIEQSIVDLGDGTYAVQFNRNGASVYVREDGNLATQNGGLVYAKLGAANSTWVALMEKAFTYFRTNAASYASISSGWMSEVYSALGVSSSNIDQAFSAKSGTALLQLIQSELAAGKSVTFAVLNAPSGSPLIGDHAYMVDHVNVDAKGNVVSLTLRNPWGYADVGSNPSPYVTITPAQALAAFMGMVAAKV